MKHRNRLLSLALSAAMALSLALPVRAADPMAGRFAAFLIDAEDVAAPQKNLQVALYRRDENGSFQEDVTVRYNCSINAVAGEASFYIQPQTDRVWVEVNYLTDLNGDGVYEMPDGEDAPVNDMMTTKGRLSPRSKTETPWSSSTYALKAGKTYTLTAAALEKGAAAAMEARSTPGSGQTLPLTVTGGTDVLYFVTVHYMSESDGQAYSLGYYLDLQEGTVIMPGDVTENDWFYDAVKFALEKGFISGTGADTFSPHGVVTRGQLAQILWRLGGSQSAADPGFPDVSSADWFYNGAAWCRQEGLMAGTDRGFEPNTTLTREQLTLVLRNFAQRAGADTGGGKGLDGFRDGADASDWARPGLEWAVGQGLLSGSDDGTLQPRKGIVRAELAAVLRSFCLAFPSAVTFS